MPNVYITNRSSHDFSDAERFGVLRYITTKRMDRFGITDMVRQAEEAFVTSQPEDYILLTSLTVLCSVCCAAFSARHGRLNLLLFKDGKYIERKVIFEKEQGDGKT